VRRGLYFDPLDPGAIASAIARLAREPEGAMTASGGRSDDHPERRFLERCDGTLRQFSPRLA